MIYKERRSINSGQVFIKYFKGLLTTAYLQKFLLQVIGICGRNDEMTTTLLLKVGYFEFSSFTR